VPQTLPDATIPLTNDTESPTDEPLRKSPSSRASINEEVNMNGDYPNPFDSTDDEIAPVHASNSPQRTNQVIPLAFSDSDDQFPRQFQLC